jgi:hypothetical protein
MAAEEAAVTAAVNAKVNAPVNRAVEEVKRSEALVCMSRDGQAVVGKFEKGSG